MLPKKEGTQKLVVNGIWCRQVSQQIYEQSSLCKELLEQDWSTLGVQCATKSCTILSPNHRESVSDFSDIPVLVAMDRHAIGCPQGNHLTLDVQVIPSTGWVLPSPSSVYGPLLSVFYDSAQPDPGVILHGCLIFSVCIFVFVLTRNYSGTVRTAHFPMLQSSCTYVLCWQTQCIDPAHFPVVFCPANLLSVACPWV